MKRFLFYCAKCDFEYSGGSEEPCSCSLCGTVNECCHVEEIEKEERKRIEMNNILVYTQKDMNDLCAILNRNGYIAIAYNIVSMTENTCCGKQWKIDYYEQKI